MNNGRDLRNSSRPGCMVHTSNRSVDLCIMVHDVCVSNNHPPESELLTRGKNLKLIHIPAVLEVVQERSRVSPAIRGRVPPPKIFKIYFWSKNGEFWCIIGGILCDLELRESKQETRCRSGKSKGAGSPTLATRPHFKPRIPDFLSDSWVFL